MLDRSEQPVEGALAPVVIPGPRLAPGWRSSRRFAVPWVGVAALLVSVVALVPLGFVASMTLEAGSTEVVALVWRPRVGELLINTALLVTITTPLCVVFGVGLAVLTETTDLPGHRLWSAIAAAPLAIPAFVHGYAWVSIAPGLHGLPAGVLVSALAYFPFLYLPVAASLRGLDPALENVAASLGLSPCRVFFRVVLPQLRLAIWGGGLLLVLHLLSEYGLYAMVRFDTFTTAIFDQFQSTFNGPAANMLAGILALLCLGLLLLEVKTRGRARYARLGAGSPREQRRRGLGRWGRAAAVAPPCVIAFLSLGVPLMTLLRWLAVGGASAWKVDEIAPALGQTLLFGAAGAVLATLAAAPIAWLAVRRPTRFARALEGVNYVTSALPGIVVALALVTIAVRFARPLYQTVITLLLAYAMMFLPRALLSLRAGVAQAPVELEEATRSLGRSPMQSLWTITLRLAAPGGAAGAAMVFLGIANELTATLLLAPNGTETLATSFWALSGEFDYAAAAPYAAIMVALSLPLTWLLYRQSQRLAGR
jgi:iron(III) transport system permease protein